MTSRPPALRVLAALALAAAARCASAGEGPPAPERKGEEVPATAGPLALDRDRVGRAVKSLADAWFVIEREGRPLGYHRLRVQRTAEGGFRMSDEMVMVPPAGKISLRSEVTTGADLLDPLRASGETLQGAEDSPTLRGSAEFSREKIELSMDLFANGRGERFPAPRRKQGTEKRPAGPILFQSLVPFLLSALDSADDGSGLGKVVLIEMPAELDRLAAFKPDRRILIEPSQAGGRRVLVLLGKDRTEAATLRFSEDGELSRIELPDLVERRAGEGEVRRAIPEAFNGN